MIKPGFCIIFILMLPGCEAIRTSSMEAARTKPNASIEQIADPAICMTNNGNFPKAAGSKGLYFGAARFYRDDIQSAQQGFDYANSPNVTLQLTPAAARKFAQISAANVGKTLPIFLDGVLLTCPIVNEPIYGGQVQISGNFTVDNAIDLALHIKGAGK